MDDIPRSLQFILEKKFKENREYWTYFKEAFWPENRKDTIERLSKLTPSDNLICQTVFDGFLQLELIIELLHSFIKKDIKINFYILVGPNLVYNLEEYYEDNESRLCPENATWDDQKKFKKKMNEKLLEVLDYHNIYDMKREAAYGEKTGLTKITSKHIVSTSALSRKFR